MIQTNEKQTNKQHSQSDHYHKKLNIFAGVHITIHKIFRENYWTKKKKMKRKKM